MKSNITRLTLLLVMLMTSTGLMAQSFTLKGKVADEDGNALELVTVSCVEQAAVAMTNLKGEFQLTLQSKDSVAIKFSMVGYKTRTRVLRHPRGTQTLQIQMFPNQELGEVIVTEKRRQTDQMEQLDLKDLKSVPSTSGNAIEELIQQQAGVSTHNELSSQYMGVFTFGMTQSAYAQDESVDTAAVQVDSAAVDSAAATTEEVEAPEPEVEEAGMYKNIKTKFIEGSAGFMALVAVALILGLAFCIERIIYLSLADVNTKKLLEGIEEKVQRGDIEGAKAIARDERGPVASIAYQGLMRMDQGLDVVERSVVSYGAVQSSYLEKGCSWITLFIAMAPSLGFLGTVIGMVQAFDDIQRAGDISPTVVAGGMKVALITTIFGIVVALILQVFYNYILAKIEGITSKMEDATISLLDIVSKYEAKK